MADWKQRVRDDVARAFAEPRREIEMSRELTMVAVAAARERNMPTPAYLRRCVIAFVSHDLDIPFPEAVALDPRVTPKMEHTPDVEGRVWGPFQIERLVGD